MEGFQQFNQQYFHFQGEGTLVSINIFAVGDMRMRTMHSLSHAATNFDMEIAYVSPPEMSLTDEFKQQLLDRGNVFQEFESVEECIGEADVIYMEPVVQPDYTKSREEVPDDYGMTPKEYKVTKKLLLEKAQSDAIVLHSLPRMDELPVDVDETRFSRYWEEAFNGVVMRMALGLWNKSDCI
ncbi:MAG: hypothetical protein ACXAC2_01095 [Candidatus Kariarchaeaceae archaeon]